MFFGPNRGRFSNIFETISHVNMLTQRTVHVNPTYVLVKFEFGQNCFSVFDAGAHGHTDIF